MTFREGDFVSSSMVGRRLLRGKMKRKGVRRQLNVRNAYSRLRVMMNESQMELEFKAFLQGEAVGTDILYFFALAAELVDVPVEKPRSRLLPSELLTWQREGTFSRQTFDRTGGREFVNS